MSIIKYLLIQFFCLIFLVSTGCACNSRTTGALPKLILKAGQGNSNPSIVISLTGSYAVVCVGSNNYISVTGSEVNPPGSNTIDNGNQTIRLRQHSQGPCKKSETHLEESLVVANQMNPNKVETVKLPLVPLDSDAKADLLNSLRKTIAGRGIKRKRSSKCFEERHCGQRSKKKKKQHIEANIARVPAISNESASPIASGVFPVVEAFNADVLSGEEAVLPSSELEQGKETDGAEVRTTDIVEKVAPAISNESAHPIASGVFPVVEAFNANAETVEEVQKIAKEIVDGLENLEDGLLGKGRVLIGRMRIEIGLAKEATEIAVAQARIAVGARARAEVDRAEKAAAVAVAKAKETAAIVAVLKNRANKLQDDKDVSLQKKRQLIALIEIIEKIEKAAEAAAKRAVG